MKLWIDDIRNAPKGWLWTRSVNEAKIAIMFYESDLTDDSIFISLDHDAGDYYFQGGDYIKLLDWLEENDIVNTGYCFHLHSQNPVGVQNMRAIIQKNNWREVNELPF